ncbi:MAG: hypothetical protein QXU32_00525 [Nitrososphaerales archaeon]
MSEGIIYYNTGTACCARLLVSAYTLRKHYSGNVTILSEGNESLEIVPRIASAIGVDYKDVKIDVPKGRGQAYLAKTKLYTISPYNITVFIDADTIIKGRVDELFTWAKAYSFVATQMVNWVTQHGIVHRRIKLWERICPELITQAVQFGKAVNTGVFGFTKDATILNEWFDLAHRGRNAGMPICDELACQILLPHHKNYIAPSDFNCSCRFGNPNSDNVRIVHYHGRKHCRIDKSSNSNPPKLICNGDLWVKEFIELYSKNVANVRRWAPAGDKVLYIWLKHNRNNI